MSITTVVVSRGVKGDKGDKGDTGAAAAVPTGTGLPHIVSGVQNAAASLLVDADVASNAAVAGSKVDPDFAAQNVVTTGDVSGTNVTASAALTGASGSITGLLALGSLKGNGGALVLPHLDVDLAGGPVTLDATQQAYPVIVAIGQLGADENLILPDTADAVYIVINKTTSLAGLHNVVFKKAGGTGVTVAGLMTQILRHDGTDYVPVTAAV